MVILLEIIEFILEWVEQTLLVITDVIRGIKYKYPLCCVIHYSFGFSFNFQEQFDYIIRYNETNSITKYGLRYVPCPKCLEKLKKEIK